MVKKKLCFFLIVNLHWQLCNIVTACLSFRPQLVISRWSLLSCHGDCPVVMTTSQGLCTVSQTLLSLLVHPEDRITVVT